MRTPALLLIFCAFAACDRNTAVVAKPAATASQATAAQAVVPPPPKPAPMYLRDHYARLADCVHDWGYPQKCTPVAPSAAEAAAGAQFFGPIYLKTYREETQTRLRQEALEGGYAQKVAEEASDRSIAKSEVKS